MKHVLNIDKIPFKDMTPEERSVIVEAKLQEEVEHYDGSCWAEASRNTIDMRGIYRTKPKQLIIPWEHINRDIKFVFIGESGYVYGCEYRPSVSKGHYESWKSEGKWYNLECMKIDTDGIHWKDSLVQRPEGV